MDFTPIGPLPQSDDEKFLSCSYEERWNRLKPMIVDIYTRRRNGRTATLDQVVQFMRTYYSFHAAPTEYRRRFRDWGVFKRMVKEDKDTITSALVKRKHPAPSVSDAITRHNGEDKPLDYKKLKRHLMSRRHRFEIKPGLLSSWNLPYAAFVASLPKNPGKPSPYGPCSPTPDYLHIQSPGPLSPGQTEAGPSPRMQLLHEKHKEHCASLFLQGRLEQLVVNMHREDRSTMVDYFHDFYMHGFVLAKDWVRELSIPSPTQAAASPWMPSLTSSSGFSSSEVLGVTNISCPSTQLCKWSIHVRTEYDEPTDNEQGAATPDLEPPPPDPERRPSSFVESLHQSMASNDFTTTPKADLPLAQDMIAQSLERNPSPLQLDAWKLAIMAGNTELLEQLFEDNGCRLPEGIESLHPYHLAAAFLDGGHHCCKTFTALSWIFHPAFAFYQNIDDYGHTILDALVVSVLRSHTNIQPSAVNNKFHLSSRFPGEEKDICGRWDADTPAVRELFKQGYPRIPTKWKHPFCHTAVQAVCHSIIAISASPAFPNINAESGLFVRLCTSCGLKLKLGPLHTLVVTAFHLAQMGMPGETLFGALAMMVCLLVLGADVSIKANVSVDHILSSSDTGECRHSPLSPIELMNAVPGGVIKTWSEDCRTGWSCLLKTLTLAAKEKLQKPSSSSRRKSTNPREDECPTILVSSSSESSDGHSCDSRFRRQFHNEWLRLPCSDPRMGILWASVQAELLTYRRVSEDEAWISENFSMEALKTWLEGGSPEFLTPLVRNQMFKTHTRCGWFTGGTDFLCPTAQEVCTYYFMNMDIYNRASYIEQPALLQCFESVGHVGNGIV